MSSIQDAPTVQDDAQDVILPPTDLWSDEPPLESDQHRRQMEILIQSIEQFFSDRQDFYVSGNLTIYYNEQQLKSKDFRGPDFFVVLDTERHARKSWVVWGEDGKYPNVIIELLSDSTADVDRGIKKELYAKTFRTPEYFWFHPDTMEFQGFQLIRGQYQPLQPNAQGWLWSDELGLCLGIHEGQLRLFTSNGQLVPIPREVAAQENQRAEQERQRAEQERQRADRLAEKLRELGIDPNNL
jgi:Uma2 family endonuclease